jgi:hypothetical protein
VTGRPHLRRGLVVVAASALFAMTASGSALAWNGTVRAVSLPPVPRSTATQAPDAALRSALVHRELAAVAAAPRAAAVVTSTRTSTSTARSARPRTSSSARPTSTPKAVTISRYVDAPGSQAQIDRCRLVLWTHAPLWLAGHNWCGYQWLAYVPTGTVVTVTTGAAAGRYVVTGHRTLHRQSGSLPSLSADLVLQTCVGADTGLTLLHRV